MPLPPLMHLATTPIGGGSVRIGARQRCVGLGVVGSNLDAVRLVIDVEHALLDLLVDLLGRVNERLLHIGCCPGRRLHKHQVVLTGERLPLLAFYFAARIQVAKTKILIRR